LPGRSGDQSLKMIIYNVTTKVDLSIVTSWLDWLKQEHIPDILATGCFYDAHIYHLFETDEEDGITYAVQYHARNIEDYIRYLEEYSGALRKKAIEKWLNQFLTFRSVLELVH
jgi:Domain of unknown function (DUF4286)